MSNCLKSDIQDVIAMPRCHKFIFVGVVAFYALVVSGFATSDTRVVGPVTVKGSSTFPLSVVDGVVSTVNSSTAPLDAGGLFVGAAEDCSQAGTIIITVYTNAGNTNTNELTVSFSPDGVLWPNGDGYRVGQNLPRTFSIVPRAKYFKVVYSNGSGSPSTEFYIQTVLKTAGIKDLVRFGTTGLTADQQAQPVVARMVAENESSGEFVSVKTNVNDRLAVAVQEVDPSITLPVSGPLTNTELRASHVNVAYGDSANLDAFSRLRVSNPEILFEATNQSGMISDTLESSSTLGGSVVLISTASRVELRTTATSGSRAILQSHGYINYQPGKSQLVLMTGMFGPAVANNSQRMGLFDKENGVYFKFTSAGAAVCERTNVGGSVVDTCVPQSAWNIDKVDGSGPSGQTLNFQKTQIYIIDFQWLGVGRVRYGFDLNGVISYVHETHHNNILSDVYMITPNLPVRFESVNTAGSSPNTLHAICAAVMSEGGSPEIYGVYFSSASANKTRTVTAAGGTVFAIRVTPGVRTTVLPLDADIYADGALYYSVVYNPTVTAGTWVTVPGSSVDVLSSTGTVVGGRTIYGGYIGSTSGTSKTVGSQAFRPSRARFATNIFGTSSDILAIVAYSVPSGNVGVGVSMGWAERR